MLPGCGPSWNPAQNLPFGGGVPLGRPGLCRVLAVGRRVHAHVSARGPRSSTGLRRSGGAPAFRITKNDYGSVSVLDRPARTLRPRHGTCYKWWIRWRRAHRLAPVWWWSHSEDGPRLNGTLPMRFGPDAAALTLLALLLDPVAAWAQDPGTTSAPDADALWPDRRHRDPVLDWSTAVGTTPSVPRGQRSAQVTRVRADG